MSEEKGEGQTKVCCKIRRVLKECVNGFGGEWRERKKVGSERLVAVAERAPCSRVL